MKKLLASLCCLAAICVERPNAVAWQDENVASADASAANSGDPIFRSIFDPLHAPSNKAMGLLQSSFLDALDRSGTKLQVAWVIDGTTSMKSTWSGLKASFPAMVQDLRLRFGENVSFAIVIYRDAGAADGQKVVMALPRFESDPRVVEEAFAAVELDSGAPYFPEPVDLAVRKALDLPWDQDPDATRWLVLIGDAPPFGKPYEDSEIGAVREVSDDVLIDQAKLKGVTIHAVLCRSDAADYPVFLTVVDQTRAFMNALANGSGGVFLDTSLDQVRAELATRSQALRAQTQVIQPITVDDVEEAGITVGKRLRIAVLPHGALKPFEWNMADPESRVAMELQQKLSQMPGVDVASAHAVERAVRLLARREQGRELTQQQANKALASQLNVDYVVWGRLDERLQMLKSGLFEGRSGELLARGEAPLEDAPDPSDGRIAGPVMLVSTLMTSGYQPSRGVDDPVLGAFLDAIRTSDASRIVVSLDPQTQRDILGAYGDLESAMAIPLGDPEAAPLLRKAERQLQQALHHDPNHPWANYLLANCHYNQAQLAAAAGNSHLAKEHSAKIRRALVRANEYADRPAVNEAGEGGPQLISNMLALQIKADYELLVRSDHPTAAELYRRLLDSPNAPEVVRRSATWMLLGLHLGDWGSPLRDPQEARRLSIEILAKWPDSPEAEFLKRVMRWRQDRGTMVAAIPLVHQVVMSE